MSGITDGANITNQRRFFGSFRATHNDVTVAFMLIHNNVNKGLLPCLMETLKVHTTIVTNSVARKSLLTPDRRILQSHDFLAILSGKN